MRAGLKRFAADADDGVFFRKTTTAVQFPVAQLDLSEFSSKARKEHEKALYNLHGAVLHRGMGLEGGHYVAIVRDGEEHARTPPTAQESSRWRLYDDNYTRLVSVECLQSASTQREVYMLVYIRRGR